jgi:hypothetical protein
MPQAGAIENAQVTTQAIKTIADRAMLVSVKVSMWSGQVLDKKIGKEVADSHNTTEKVGHYKKKLLPGSEELKRVWELGSALRREVLYKRTLPWKDDGKRIMLASAYEEFTREMKKAIAEFDAAVEAFIARYPDLRREAQITLNGMFNEADYPDMRDIRLKFGAKPDIEALPQARDFRVDLSQGAVDVIRSGIEESVRLACQDAQRCAWEKIRTCLAAMVERLTDPKAVYRDSLFGNVAELVDILPTLNVLEDPEMDKVARKVRDEVLAYSAQQCRDDKDARAQAAAKVDAIMKLMPVDA